MEQSNVLFFFKEEDYLSQWYYSPFIIDNVNFSCCEQWMMYSKAMLFKDYVSAKEILAEDSPGKQKEIGRDVNGFRDRVWSESREEIVYKGNLAKFSQNEELKRALIGTDDCILAEANPNDPIWGIGLSESQAKKRYSSQWRGKNLLGKIIMKVRQELQK